MKLEMCLQEGNKKKKQETDISTHRFCAQIIRDNVFLNQLAGVYRSEAGVKASDRERRRFTDFSIGSTWGPEMEYL